eukprot:2301083-Rhodomonas_salina.2
MSQLFGRQQRASEHLRSRCSTLGVPRAVPLLPASARRSRCLSAPDTAACHSTAASQPTSPRLGTRARFQPSRALRASGAEAAPQPAALHPGLPSCSAGGRGGTERQSWGAAVAALRAEDSGPRMQLRLARRTHHPNQHSGRANTAKDTPAPARRLSSLELLRWSR